MQVRSYHSLLNPLQRLPFLSVNTKFLAVTHEALQNLHQLPSACFSPPCLACFRQPGLIAMPGTLQNAPILRYLYWLLHLLRIHFPWMSTSSILQTPLSFFLNPLFLVTPLWLFCIIWQPISTLICYPLCITENPYLSFCYFFHNTYHLLIRYIHYLFIYYVESVYFLFSSTIT